MRVWAFWRVKFGGDSSEVQKAGHASTDLNWMAVRRLACVLAVLVAILSSCQDEWRRCDPGDARLNAILSDPALKIDVRGAHGLPPLGSPATQPPYSHQCEGPSAFRRYRVTGSPDAVLRAYESAVPKLGWRFRNRFQPAGTPYPYVNYVKQFGRWRAKLNVHVISDDRPEMNVKIYAPPITASR